MLMSEVPLYLVVHEFLSRELREGFDVQIGHGQLVGELLHRAIAQILLVYTRTSMCKWPYIYESCPLRAVHLSRHKWLGG